MGCYDITVAAVAAKTSAAVEYSANSAEGVRVAEAANAEGASREHPRRDPIVVEGLAS